MSLIKSCPAYRDYDVFGLPNKGCCYYYMDYCENHPKCILKEIVKLCKEQNNEISKIIINKLKVEEENEED